MPNLQNQSLGESGKIVTTGDANTVTSTMILDGTILNVDINASANIALSKLATSTAGNIIVYNASGVPTAVAETGDVTISDTGVTAIAANSIINADINTAAAIAYSKLSLANTIVNADISTAAAVAHSKLANATAGQILLGTTTTGVITATTISGDVTITGAGLTGIAANSIVNADINSAAAINTTKITNWENDQIVLSNQIFG